MQASAYLNKLPAKLDAEDRILVVDPMLATGNISLGLLLQFALEIRLQRLCVC